MFVVVKFDGLKAAAKKGMNPSRQYKLLRDVDNVIDVAIAAATNFATETEETAAEEDFADLTSSAPARSAAPAPTKERAARVTNLLNK
jgi:hypothetical protein